MGFAQEMENLVQNFVNSFDQRRKDIARIYNNAHDIQKEGRKMMSRIHNGNGQLFDETQKFLKDFRNRHRATSREDEQKRRKFCKEFAENVQKHMKGVRNEFANGHKAFQQACATLRRHREKAAPFPKPLTGRGFSGSPSNERPRKRPSKARRATKS